MGSRVSGSMFNCTIRTAGVNDGASRAQGLDLRQAEALGNLPHRALQNTNLEPDGADVTDFANQVALGELAADANARAWCSSPADEEPKSVEGEWSSRWNGGVDGTISGDHAARWKAGKARVSSVGDRVYLLFDWDNGARRALVDARRSGHGRLLGRYINLSDPTSTSPWAGLIVDNTRIDGRWTSGRLDFRR